MAEIGSISYSGTDVIKKYIHLHEGVDPYKDFFRAWQLRSLAQFKELSYLVLGRTYIHYHIGPNNSTVGAVDFLIQDVV